MTSLRVIRQGTGIIIKRKGVKLALDTGVPGTTTLLSHAHSDHIGGLSVAREVISTTATLDTLLARGGKLPAKVRELSFGETVGQLGVYITPLNAGHVIGSAMFKIGFDDGVTILYTGDFNSVNSIVHEGAKPVHSDILIMEATYGTPQWIFPERESVHRSIVQAARELIDVGRVPVFRAYSLGKAQEAIALLEQNGIDVVSGNKAIDSVSAVYSKHGVPLRFTSLEDKHSREHIREGCAIITSAPRHMLSNIRKAIGPSYAKDLERRAETFNLSGWTLGEYRNGGFPLSAHTDFPHLLAFAEQVGARITYCFTSNAGTLSAFLNERGVNAIPLE